MCRSTFLGGGGRRITHHNEVYGGRWLSITIAMPLDPAIGFAMVGFFFEDWLPHEYYSYACIGFYLPICLSAYLGAKKITKKHKETEDAILKKRF